MTPRQTIIFALATLTIFGGVVFADTTFLQVEVKTGGVSAVSWPVDPPSSSSETSVPPSSSTEESEAVLNLSLWGTPETLWNLYWESILLETFETDARGFALWTGDLQLGNYVVQGVDQEGGLIQMVENVSSAEQNTLTLVMSPTLYADSDEENLYFYGFFLPEASVQFNLLSASMQAQQSAVTDEQGLFAFALPIESFVYGDYELFIEGAYQEDLFRSESLLFEYVPEPQDPGYVEYMEATGQLPEDFEEDHLDVEVEEALDAQEESKQEENAEIQTGFQEERFEANSENQKSWVNQAVSWLLGEKNVDHRVQDGRVQSVELVDALPSQDQKPEKKSFSHPCPQLSFFDKNGDCRVNYADVILLKGAVQENQEFIGLRLEQDFSGDGLVTLQDYSILAYYWTY